MLIHTSTIAVVMGGARILEHTEPRTPEVSESRLVLGEYARDRRRAEQVVLSAHGSTTLNGEEVACSNCKNNPSFFATSLLLQPLEGIHALQTNLPIHMYFFFAPSHKA